MKPSEVLEAAQTLAKHLDEKEWKVRVDDPIVAAIAINDEHGKLVVALRLDGTVDLGVQPDLVGAIDALPEPWQRTLARALAGAAAMGSAPRAG